MSCEYHGFLNTRTKDNMKWPHWPKLDGPLKLWNGSVTATDILTVFHGVPQIYINNYMNE